MESYQCTRKKDTRKQKKLVRRFSKKWVPSVAMGDPEESGMIERFAAPTISSLTKRNRNASA